MHTPQLERLFRWLREWRVVDVWYDACYRLPLSTIEGTGVEPRRADAAAFYLVEAGASGRHDFHLARPISYAKLARVHDESYLEALSRPETLAQIYAVDPSDIVVDELLHTVRVACGATLAAARYALAAGCATLNLLGGFHHARRSGGGGFCALNDVAVAVTALRAKGVTGQIAVVDLDAHPPDGTADCLRADRAVWIGSLSGSAWGPLPEGVDETLLPEGTGDGAYLDALEALLRRMPKSELAFVLAGGDVLAGDKLGRLALTLKGARRRDALVAEALRYTPSVWLPAGGYHRDSWKVLAGTGLVLSGRTRRRIPRKYDPLHARYLAISKTLLPKELAPGLDDGELSQADVDDALRGASGRREFRLLGYYTAQGLEYALYRFGVLETVRRFGFSELHVAVDTTGTGDRLRLFGTSNGQQHVLVEVVAEKRHLDGADYLFINWLSLRNPRAKFSAVRPQLPGQDVPGLGLAREVGELLALMARRLELQGVAFRPAWYHVAYAARSRFRFADPERQGRFEALIRDLSGVPLVEATRAISEGCVLLDGQPYRWEPEDMVFPLDEAPASRSRVADRIRAARDETHFSLPATTAPRPPET